MSRAALVAISLAVVACGTSSNSGVPAGDGGGASAPDGGGDSGGSNLDADAPGGDAGPPMTPVAQCTDTLANVYVTPTGLPAMVASARGDVVRCAVDTAIDASAMSSRLSTAGVSGVSVASSAHTWRVEYRTKRATGDDGASTARVYLPDAPRSPMPVLVVAHGTLGIADVCAPSQYEALDDYLILPWVAHGYAVIATDYAGLGNEGTPGYLDETDTAQSVLDAARALRKLVGAGAFGSQVVVLGHSEGGGAAISAQALDATYGDSNVAGVLAFAPGWPIAADVSGMEDTSVASTVAGGYPVAFSSLEIAAYFATRVGATHEGDGFGAADRTAILTALNSQCINMLPTSVPQAAATVGDLLDPTFRATTLGCAGVDAGAACADPGQSYLAYLKANLLNASATGGKVLVVQGLADTIVQPSTTACVVAKLAVNGAPSQLCTDQTATHLTVVQQNAGFALSWVDALVAGGALPTCTGTGLPACP